MNLCRDVDCFLTQSKFKYNSLFYWCWLVLEINEYTRYTICVGWGNRTFRHWHEPKITFIPTCNVLQAHNATYHLHIINFQLDSTMERQHKTSVMKTVFINDFVETLLTQCACLFIISIPLVPRMLNVGTINLTIKKVFEICSKCPKILSHKSLICFMFVLNAVYNLHQMLSTFMSSLYGT